MITPSATAPISSGAPVRRSRRRSTSTPPARARRKRPNRRHPMQSQNRFFDDMARVAAGAMGALSGVRGEIEARFRDQLERILADMDLVSREEFEAVKAMAAKAREEQEVLLQRIAELETRLAQRGQVSQSMVKNGSTSSS